MNGLYWILIADGIIGLFAFIAGLSITALLMITIARCNDDCPQEDFVSIAKVASGIALFSILVCVFTPSTKQLCALVVADSVKEIVDNNEKVQKLPEKAVLYLDKLMEEYLKEE